jgi:hypothetical protein
MAAAAGTDVLGILAAELREEGPVVAPLVVEPADEPVLGLLVAAGPRCAEAPGAYATVVEAVREGYLLHYGRSRLLPELDPDLRLLIGDHLYARGIEQLAGLGDRLAVNELSDLISITAQLDAADAPSRESAEIAWLASAIAIAVGASDAHERAKACLRAAGDARPLWHAAEEGARLAGLSDRLAMASEAVGFPARSRG